MKYFLLLSTLFLSGCAIDPVMRESNKAHWHNEYIDTIAIIYGAKKLGEEASRINDEEFSKIDDAFISTGLSTDIFFYSGLDLDGDKKLKHLISKNHYYLLIDPVKMASGAGGAESISYHLSLFETKTKQKIWVANLYVPFGWTESVHTRFDEIGKLIVDRLAEDGLIRNLEAAQ